MALSTVGNADFTGTLISYLYDEKKPILLRFVAPKNAAAALVAKAWQTSGKEGASAFTMVWEKQFDTMCVGFKLPNDNYRSITKAVKDAGQVEVAIIYEGATIHAKSEAWYTLGYGSTIPVRPDKEIFLRYCDFREAPNNPKYDHELFPLWVVDLYNWYADLKRRIRIPLRPEWICSLWQTAQSSYTHDPETQGYVRLVTKKEYGFITEDFLPESVPVKDGIHLVRGSEVCSYYTKGLEYHRAWVNAVLEAAKNNPITSEE